MRSMKAAKPKPEERPIVVPVTPQQPAVGAMDDWLRVVRRPGPPRKLNYPTAAYLQEARAES